MKKITEEITSFQLRKLDDGTDLICSLCILSERRKNKAHAELKFQDITINVCEACFNGKSIDVIKTEFSHHT